MKIDYARMSPQAYAVLDEIKFQYGCCYLPRLALNLGVPVASIRRSLGELRQAGLNLTLKGGFVSLNRKKR